MRFKIPSEFMGVTSDEALKSVEDNKPAQNPVIRPQQIVPTPATNIHDPASYLILEGRTHGKYSYPDLLVPMHRLGLDANVQKVAQEIGINLTETGQEADGTKYIGDINWNQALSLNAKLGNITLNPRQFIDFKELIEQGMSGAKAVYDGNGNPVQNQRLTSMYDEIFTVRTPWRSEWLDAKFSKVDQSLLGKITDLIKGHEYFMEYNHTLTGNTLNPLTTEALEKCVMNDGWIDVGSFNNQGLPTRASNDNKLYFWYPRAGKVARFGADSDGAGLFCSRYPTGAGSSLGVRAARKKI